MKNIEGLKIRWEDRKVKMSVLMMQVKMMVSNKVMGGKMAMAKLIVDVMMMAKERTVVLLKRAMEVKRNVEVKTMIEEDIAAALKTTLMVKILALTVLWLLMQMMFL